MLRVLSCAESCAFGAGAAKVHFADSSVTFSVLGTARTVLFCCSFVPGPSAGSGRCPRYYPEAAVATEGDSGDAADRSAAQHCAATDAAAAAVRRTSPRECRSCAFSVRPPHPQQIQFSSWGRDGDHPWLCQAGARCFHGSQHWPAAQRRTGRVSWPQPSQEAH